jgi:hypothetical protein
MSTEGAQPAGSVGEEAARLLEALEAWVRQHGAGSIAARVATGSPECCLCPLCHLLGALRTARPETFEHLLDASGSLAAALRSALDAHESDRRRSRVQRVDISG